MLDMKFVRENPDAVKENIKKKFQDEKLPLVDEVIALDEEARAAKQEADALRADRNKLSKQIGMLMAQGKKEEAEEIKKLVTSNSERLANLEAKETELEAVSFLQHGSIQIKGKQPAIFHGGFLLFPGRRHLPTLYIL